jgi:hypothetical protein
MPDTGDRRTQDAPVDYIDCDVPRDMTLREWRGGQPPPRTRRLRAAAAAVGRAARLRRRAA